MRCTIIAMVITSVLAGCSSTSNVNPMLNEVQTTYNEAAKDSVVVNNAPEELKKAREAVSDVRAAIAKDESDATIKQKYNLAEQRIRVARKAAELRASREEVQQKTNELRMLLDSLQSTEREAIASGHIDVSAEEGAKQLIHFTTRRADRGLILRFRNLRFSTEKAMLVSNAEPPINELADFLNMYPDRLVRIEGHTDNTGSESFNKQLSQERAEVVMDALISRGVDGVRIEAVGMGEAYPIASNDTESGRERNRRVDVLISDENGEFPLLRQ